MSAARHLHAPIAAQAYARAGPAVKPTIAFMLDIRRDNLLEHLLFKSLFAMARNRAEYLCLLFGKPVPCQ